MKTLMMRLKGMCSFGEVAKEVVRTTLSYPTFSAILGMCRCAMGVRSHDQKAKKLLELTMAVRINSPIQQECDYHTVKDVRTLNRIGKQNVITYRYYLVDADFIVALNGKDDLIQEIAEALKHPAYHLYMGRMSCVPTTPVFMAVTDDETPLAALKALRESNTLKLYSNNGMAQFVVAGKPHERGADHIRDVPTENGYDYRDVKMLSLKVGE